MPPNDQPQNDRRRPKQGTGSKPDFDVVQEGVRGIITAFEGQVHAVDAALEKVEAEARAIDKMLRGDGDREGMVQRQAMMAQEIERIRADIKELKIQYNKLLWWIITLLVSIVGSLLATFAIAKTVVH